jgi:hypothetical protein
MSNLRRRHNDAFVSKVRNKIASVISSVAGVMKNPKLKRIFLKASYAVAAGNVKKSLTLMRIAGTYIKQHPKAFKTSMLGLISAWNLAGIGVMIKLIKLEMKGELEDYEGSVLDKILTAPLNLFVALSKPLVSLGAKLATKIFEPSEMARMMP